MSKDIYFVNHTHWDREWYFSKMDALVLSNTVFKEVLDELSQNSNQKFCLDGQTSIIEDYLRIRPEDYSRIKKLVRSGQLDIGPWFTQTDCLYVDGESILRNLMIGIHYSKNKFDKVMQIGYLPDSFGFNAQLPTYLNHVGINHFINWRGIDFDSEERAINFNWKSLNNINKVTAATFPLGYYTGQLTTEYMKNLDMFLNERLIPSIEFHEKNSSNNNEPILIPSGYDQMNITKDLQKAIDYFNKNTDYNFKSASYTDYLSQLNPEMLPEYQGELRSPRYARVHRSIGSVRMSIKLANFSIEQKLIKRLEPLLVLSNKMGIEIGSGILVDIWKKVLENQAHDSLGGCVSDSVAEDIMGRFKEAEEAVDACENLILKKMAEKLRLGSKEVLVVNPVPHKFKGTKIIKILSESSNISIPEAENIEIIDKKYYPARKNIQKYVAEGTEQIEESSYYELTLAINVELPAFGYKVFDIESTSYENIPKIQKNQFSISNKKYEIRFINNKLELCYNKNVIKDFISLVDEANDGDTYDFSPLKNDVSYKLEFNDCKIYKGNINHTMELSGNTKLPTTLKDRTSANKSYTDIGYKLILKLKKNSHLIEGEILFDNNIYSHRLRLKIKTNSDKDYTIASIPNGFSKNDNRLIEDNWQEKYEEKPVNIFALDKSVSSLTKEYIMTVHTKGMREYEFKKGDLYITLLATTGELGKPNLAWRPGRASGDTTDQGHVMMSTPLAQEIGEKSFVFSVSLLDEFDESQISQLNSEFNSVSISYQLQNFNYFIYRVDNKIFTSKTSHDLSKEYIGLNLNEDLEILAIHPSFITSDEFIIRIGNSTNTKKTIKDNTLLRGTVVNALEEPLEQKYEIDPYGLLSIKVKCA